MANAKPTALLIEDEKQIRRFVRSALEDVGWPVNEAETISAGLSAASTRNPDLIVLDLGLPDGDGMDLLRDLRTWSKVPVIVLSARVSEEDKVLALDAGADDYLTKPFGLGEFLARVRAASRRRGSREEPAAIFEFGEISVNKSLRTVKKAGSDIHPTPIEYPPGVLTRTPAQAETATLRVAASFDVRLARLNGVVIGREARALGIDLSLQPFINIDRDLTMRRLYNTFGEDPLLTGAMGAATIRGIQSQHVMAMAKHFVAFDTAATDVWLDDQTLHEVYEAAVHAGAASVMCSYNHVNGKSP